MKVIPREVISVKEPFKIGNFGNIYKTEVNKEKYCYKEFKVNYPRDIIKNLADLTNECFSEEYLTPKYMVVDLDENNFNGYLTKDNGSLCAIKKDLEVDKQILLLKKAQLITLKLHSQFGRIHGDLNDENILFSEDNYEPFLLDFDSSLRFGQPVGSLVSFSKPIKDYLKYYSVDYKIDAYSFNLTTLAVLIGCDWMDVLSRISNDDYNFPNENVMTRKLAKEMLLRDTKKPYSGEYIINYID